MAKLTNISEGTRKAVNRMPVLSEKDKRLLHVAFDGEAAALTNLAVLRDGTTPLTANWDVGAFDIVNVSNMGIGTSAPEVRLEVIRDGTTSVKTWTPNANDILILDSSASGHAILNILGSATGTGRIRFPSPTNSSRGEILYDIAANYMSFGTSGAEKMRIDAAGNVGIGNTPSGDYKFEVTGDIGTSGFNILPPTTGITAFAGGGQGSAVELTVQFNEVGTVATIGDSVKLQTAVAGKSITVRNTGANQLDLFPNTSDSIDGQAVNTAIQVAVNAVVTLYAWDNTEWAQI